MVRETIGMIHSRLPKTTRLPSPVSSKRLNRMGECGRRWHGGSDPMICPKDPNVEQQAARRRRAPCSKVPLDRSGRWAGGVGRRLGRWVDPGVLGGRSVAAQRRPRLVWAAPLIPDT